MAYTKQVWVDDDATKPLSADRMNYLEDGIADAEARVNHTGTQAASTITGLSTVATSGSYDDLSAKPTIPSPGTTAGTYTVGNDARLSDTRVPTDSSVTNAKVATGAAIDADKLADGANNKLLLSSERTKLNGIAAGATANSSDATLLNRANHTGLQTADTVVDGTTNKAFTATEKTKLTGIATGATANATDAALRDRASHTGTQSADTLTDGTTNKAFLATERTKLAGIATAATANSTDATLLARGNHTGTQLSTTISDFIEAAQDASATLFTGGSHTGISFSYNDAANTLNATVSAGAAYTTEEAQDAAAALFSGGIHTNISATYDDANNRLNLALLGVRTIVLNLGDAVPGGTPADTLIVRKGTGTDSTPSVRGSVYADAGAAGSQTTGSIVLPSTVAGDRIYVVATNFNNSDMTISGAGSWTTDALQSLTPNLQGTKMFRKTADGTEGGQTVTVTFAAGTRWAMTGVVVANPGTSPLINISQNNVDTTTFNIPAITPANANAFLLEIAAIRYNFAATVETATPTGWTELIDSATTNTSGVKNGFWVGTRQLTSGAGVSQGPWTSTTSTSRDIQYTIALYPSSATSSYFSVWDGSAEYILSLAGGAGGGGGAAGPAGPTGATGRGFAPRGTYALSTAYAIDDIVTYLGSTYRVTTAHTPSGSLNTTNLELWASKGDTGATGATGSAGATGPAGATGTGFTPRGVYTLGVSYAINDVVTYLGSTYRVANAHTPSGSLNTTNLEIWAQKGDTGATGNTGTTGATGSTGPAGRGFTPRGTYALGVTYAVDDIVTHLGASYRVSNGHTTSGSLNTTNLELWAAKGDTGSTGATGSAGPTGPTGASIAAPYRWGAAVATAGETPLDRIHTAGVLTKLRVYNIGAPAGSSLTVQLRRKVGAGAWANVGSAASITAGTADGYAEVALSQSVALDDLVRLNVTSIGSTTAATGVTVVLDWTL